MKNILILFLMIVLFSSCKEKRWPSIPTESFKQIFGGVWVKSEYIDDIAKRRFPYLSQDKLNGFTVLTINRDLINDSSAVVKASINNEPDFTFSFTFKPGLKPTSFKIFDERDYIPSSNFSELGYEIIGHDTSLILYNYTENHKLSDSTKYTKVLNKPLKDKFLSGLQYAVNEKLILGTYSFLDFGGKIAKATFTNDGEVTGLPGFKTYYISTNFGPENDRDQLFFDIQPDKFFYDLEPKDQKRYLFKVAGDTLNIFNISTKRDETGGLNFGSLKYRLVKLK